MKKTERETGIIDYFLDEIYAGDDFKVNSKSTLMIVIAIHGRDQPIDPYVLPSNEIRASVIERWLDEMLKDGLISWDKENLQRAFITPKGQFIAMLRVISQYFNEDED